MLLGAQTYTIRTYCQNEEDFRESMRRVAEIGYTTVQLSGIGPMEPTYLRRVCDEFGLSIVLTHTNPDRILNDTDAVIREHEILGCPYIGIGSMPGCYRNAEGIHNFAADFTLPAKKIADSGRLLMYHNHNFEWEHIGKKVTLMDVLMETMPAELMGVTLDTYWVQAAGADVLAAIDRFADRIPCVHLKDMAVKGMQQQFAPVGEGNLDFPRILAKLKEIGKTKYMLVEQDDSYGESPFDCLKQSFDNVKEMGY